MKKISIFLINIYQKSISPLMKNVFGGGCRFYPTCSDYAKEAINKYGLIKGGSISIKRLLKCHPGVNNYFDPVI
jgi:putative membrane protein insertion efficiency factor